MSNDNYQVAAPAMVVSHYQPGTTFEFTDEHMAMIEELWAPLQRVYVAAVGKRACEIADMIATKAQAAGKELVDGIRIHDLTVIGNSYPEDVLQTRIDGDRLDIHLNDHFWKKLS